jgi:hypothetical protein
MAELVKEGVTSFKFFLAYKGVFQVSDDQFLHALAKAKELGALAMVRPGSSHQNAFPKLWRQCYFFSLFRTSGASPQGRQFKLLAPVFTSCHRGVLAPVLTDGRFGILQLVLTNCHSGV